MCRRIYQKIQSCLSRSHACHRSYPKQISDNKTNECASVKWLQTNLWENQSMDDLSTPLTPTQPPIDGAERGQTGVKPLGSKVRIRPVPSWKLDQTNCPSVHFNYSRIKSKSRYPVTGPWHQSWLGEGGGWGGYYGWKIKLCMLQCTGHKSKFPI